MCESSQRQAGTSEIELTPAMIATGLYALADVTYGQSKEELVTAVYLAMRLEERQTT